MSADVVSKPPMRLIQRYEAARLWAGKPLRNEYGEKPHPAIGTGRASCRVCGQRIAKGDLEIRFTYDFVGCGSWTVVQCHMHASNCLEQAVAR